MNTRRPPTSAPPPSFFDFQLHRTGFVWVSNMTDPTRVWPMECPPDIMAAEGGCWVPDALLRLNPAPKRNAQARFSSGSDGGDMVAEGTMPLTPGLTSAVWITVTAPPRPSAPLLKDMVVHVVVNDVTMLNLTVHERNFTLPLSPSLKNTVQLDIAHLHRCFPDESEESTYRRYHQYAEYVMKNMSEYC